MARVPGGSPFCEAPAVWATVRGTPAPSPIPVSRLPFSLGKSARLFAVAVAVLVAVLVAVRAFALPVPAAPAAERDTIASLVNQAGTAVGKPGLAHNGALRRRRSRSTR